MSIKSTNAKFKAAGLPVELVKGEGYMYFVYDTLDTEGRQNGKYDTYSVMTPYYKDCTPARWFKQGEEFAAAVVAGKFWGGEFH